jgi:hypothetical protein
VSGFVALAASVGVLMAILAAVASPRAVRACRRGLASLPRPTEAQLDALARSLAYTNPTYVPFELSLDLRLLTDDQLGRAWSDGQAEMSSHSSPRALSRAAEERGRYLDELERRQPSLLSAWLASDAEDPDSLLLNSAASRPVPLTIDWDELTGGQASDR